MLDIHCWCTVAARFVARNEYYGHQGNSACNALWADFHVSSINEGAGLDPESERWYRGF